MTADSVTGDTAEDGSEEEPAGTRVVVLDLLPRGRSEDDRARFRRSPVALAVGIADFTLYELRLDDDHGVRIGDRVVIDGPEPTGGIEEVGEVPYDDLTGGAQSELEYAVEEIVEADQQRFVDFFTEAQPVTTRLHSLDLLPGIGETLRNNVIDARKRGPFESFEGLEERVSGLHDPEAVLVERILDELREEDLKYRLFVRRE